MKVQCTHDKLVLISELVPHPKNRNKHSEDQIIRLSQILNYQGWRYPVKVSIRSGFITSGHGRVEAAKLNGWQSVPVNYQDYDSDEQEYADVQSDNAIASWAELDLSGINLDLENLGPDFDIALLGIKHFTIDVAERNEPKEKGPIENYLEDENRVLVLCANENIQAEIFEELSKREGVECKIL